jgi:NAD(P)-dependent dehydrogenase (short-subunit alcohol dehydrogenase family)
MTYRDLEGKTALITGSGKKAGIGFAIAQRLASCGANIVIADLGEIPGEQGMVKTGTWEEMEAIASELKGRFGVDTLAVSVDIAHSQFVSRMVAEVQRHFNHIDVLCNNAGADFGAPSEVHNYDETEWMKSINVNLHGAFRVSKMVIPLMLGRKGSIINTSSRAGKFPPLHNGAYAVAKAGLIMLTKVMAKELAESGLRVNAICPGQIMTDMERMRFEREAKSQGISYDERVGNMCETIPLGRIGSPEEVADLVAFLASESSSFITGQAINITGGQLMEL